MYVDNTIGQGAAMSASVPASLKQSKSVGPIAKRAFPASEKAAPEPQLPKGTWFDPALDFRDPEGDALTVEILSLLAAVEPRRRKLKLADARNRYDLVRAILANGFRCHFYRSPHRVAYSRRAKGYSDGPQWLNGRAMAWVVDLMAAARLVNTYPGKRGQASTFHIMPRLYGIAQANGISAHSLTYPLPPERLVRLRVDNSKTPYLPFEPTDDSRRWTEQLEAYNAFIRLQDIALKLTQGQESAWVKHWNDERRERKGKCPALCRPEWFQTDLYRQFNKSSFDQGGRLYGGFWINVPGDLRKLITINGKPTVELDYSGCHIRMLYHLRGIDYQGDPYQLDELTACEAENGLPLGYFRESMKRLVQALINGNPGGKPEQAKIKGFSFLPYFKRPQLRRMIEEKHAPIRDDFGNGEGLRLQRLDSDIALSIINRLREQGICALSVHDSFVVPEDAEAELRQLMEEEYMSIFHYRPMIR